MMKTRKAILENLYAVFSTYGAGIPFSCDHCYCDSWQQYYLNTPLREIDGDHGYSIVTEVYDHWVNSETYRYYLPRILELMGPPYFLHGVCPEHVFGTLAGLDFKRWHKSEQLAVFDYLELLGAELPFELDEEKVDWESAYGLFKEKNQTV